MRRLLFTVAAVVPLWARLDQNSQVAHQQLLAKAKAGRIDIYFVGKLDYEAMGKSSIRRKALAGFPGHGPVLRHDGLSSLACKLEGELLRLECCRFRLGSGPGGEYSLQSGGVDAADGGRIRYLNISGQLAGSDGKLHPTVNGYQVWADALKPILNELLGQRAAEDHGPAPTGDPSAHRNS